MHQKDGVLIYAPATLLNLSVDLFELGWIYSSLIESPSLRIVNDFIAHGMQPHKSRS